MSAPPPDKPAPIAFDLIARLRAMAEDGPRTARHLAAFALENPHFASTAAIAEIAGRTGTSEPSVTRFARALGCTGMADFKLRLAQAMAVGGLYVNAAPPSPEERETLVLHAVCDAAQAAVERARRLADMAAMSRAASILAQSRRVLCFGSGGTSSLLAMEMQNRLFRLGLDVRAETDGHMQAMLASVADRRTSVIAFSVSGRNRPLLRANAIARDYGAQIIAVTAHGTPLAEACDVALEYAFPEDGNIYKPSSGRFGLLATADILAMATAQTIGPSMLEGIRRIKQTLNTHLAADPNLPVGD
ncbi:MurR/RpiR family transcriptional regulator [Aureimonas frigidaquae]|uniref:RpiR family transcriptional regulator n=1 Tax=Aureimonas frigidaquae TaxID=424757 RepID=A0A0P0Z330_9HYPH|nr:MurR/RpiR family transcriptional regulator [Aureimonas frigidaquae]BAT28446.1 RpiR family transcriptional regulator [Aureimonas frigidaquae]